MVPAIGTYLPQKYEHKFFRSRPNPYRGKAVKAKCRCKLGNWESMSGKLCGNFSKLEVYPPSPARHSPRVDKQVFCATCNEHSLKRHEKTGVNNDILLAIHFLSVIVINLLFACPPHWHWHRPSPLHCLLLFPQAAAHPLRNGWLLFALVCCPLCRCRLFSNR